MKFIIGKGGDVKVYLVFKETETIAEAQELFSFIKGKNSSQENPARFTATLSTMVRAVLLWVLAKRESLATKPSGNPFIL